MMQHSALSEQFHWMWYCILFVCM